MTNGTKALKVFEEPLELFSDGLVVSAIDVVNVSVFVVVLEVPEIDFEAELDTGTPLVPEEFEEIEAVLLTEVDTLEVVEDTVGDELSEVSDDELKLV